MPCLTHLIRHTSTHIHKHTYYAQTLRWTNKHINAAIHTFTENTHKYTLIYTYMHKQIDTHIYTNINHTHMYIKIYKHTHTLIAHYLNDYIRKKMNDTSMHSNGRDQSPPLLLVHYQTRVLTPVTYLQKEKKLDKIRKNEEWKLND